MFLSLRNWADKIIFEGLDPAAAKASVADDEAEDAIDEENNEGLEALRLASLYPAAPAPSAPPTSAVARSSLSSASRAEPSSQSATADDWFAVAPTSHVSSRAAPQSAIQDRVSAAPQSATQARLSTIPQSAAAAPLSAVTPAISSQSSASRRRIALAVAVPLRAASRQPSIDGYSSEDVPLHPAPTCATGPAVPATLSDTDIDNEQDVASLAAAAASPVRRRPTQRPSNLPSSVAVSNSDTTIPIPNANPPKPRPTAKGKSKAKAKDIADDDLGLGAELGRTTRAGARKTKK